MIKSKKYAGKPTRIKGFNGWTDAPTEMTRLCAFVEIYGDTGTGRTTLALTAPGPIALLHASEKIDGIIQPFAKDKEIRMMDFGAVFKGTQDEIADQAMAIWVDLKHALYDAYGWARTIVIDTHTEAWELIRLAFFGGYKPTSGRVDANYGPVNAEWRSFFKEFRHQDRTNVIAIGQTKDEYKDKAGVGNRTGKTIRAGQREVPGMADIILRTSKDGTGRFWSTLEKCWYNAVYEGMEFDNEDSNFPWIMGIATELGAEKWS